MIGKSFCWEYRFGVVVKKTGGGLRKAADQEVKLLKMYHFGKMIGFFL